VEAHPPGNEVGDESHQRSGSSMRGVETVVAGGIRSMVEAFVGWRRSGRFPAAPRWKREREWSLELERGGTGEAH
jgi:hypothetical protein